MFGFYRIALALMVTANHLLGLPSIGGYAVFGFYTLSGYLMTLIMHQSYGYSIPGKIKYVINRILRIYPTYWASIILSALIIIIVGETYSTEFHRAMYLPNDLSAIFRNIFIFFPERGIPRLTQPAWALTVELFFYILIGLGISKNKKLVNIWLFVSITYHIVIFIMGIDWSYRYFPVTAASLPFSTGAFIYHRKDFLISLRNKFFKQENSSAPFIVFGLIILNWMISLVVEWFIASGTNQYQWDYTWGIFLYINFLLNVLIIVILIGQKSLPYINKKTDKLSGDLSYPLYLFHEPLGLACVYSLSNLGISIQKHSPMNFMITLPISLFIAFIVTKTLENPINKVRKKVRG